MNFYCNAKKDICDLDSCTDCKFFDDTGGYEVEEAKPMTNGDRIRSMSDEELAEFLEAVTDACYDPSINHCRNCPMLGHRVGEDFCDISNWLKQPCEVEI